MNNPDTTLRMHWLSKLTELGVDKEVAAPWIRGLEAELVGPCTQALLKVSEGKDNPGSYVRAALRDGWWEEVTHGVSAQKATSFGEGMAIADGMDGGPYWALSEERQNERLRAYRRFRSKLPRVVLKRMESRYCWQTEGGQYFTAVFQSGSRSVKRGLSYVQMPTYATHEGESVDAPTYVFPEYPMMWVQALQARPVEPLEEIEL